MRGQACIGARFAFCKTHRRVGGLARRELAAFAQGSFLSILATVPAGIYRPTYLESVSYLRPWEEVLVEEINGRDLAGVRDVGLRDLEEPLDLSQQHSLAIDVFYGIVKGIATHSMTPYSNGPAEYLGNDACHPE